MTRDKELEELNEDLVCQLLLHSESFDYLLGRGLTSETIMKWQLGYCPPTWNNALRGRVTFPIVNAQSHLVSIGGRILPQYMNGKTPKYYNLPYSKSTTLFGLSECIQTKGIQELGCAVVVEDYFGVLVAHQVGYHNVVSVCGSFLTEVHLGMLLRETDIIVVAFDNDEGGEKGWANAQEMSQKYDYPITKLLLEKDLDEVLVSDPKWLSSAIREAILKPPVLDHLKSLRTRLEGLSNEGQ